MAYGVPSYANLSCSYAERYYKELVSLIDAIIIFPKESLRIMLENIDTIKTTIYDAYAEQVDELLKKLDEYLDLKDPSKVLDCDQLMHCKILVQGYVDKIKDSLRRQFPEVDGMDAFDIFRRFVCGNGLSDMYADFKRDLKAYILTNVEALLNNDAVLWIESKVRKMIRDYEDLLMSPIDSYFPPFSTMFNLAFPFAETGMGLDATKMNIYDLLDFMDVFMGCVFEGCSLVESARNKSKDVRTKLKIDPIDRRYVYDKKTLELVNAKMKMQQTLEDMRLKLA